MYIQKTVLCKEAQSISKTTKKKKKQTNKKSAKEQRERFTKCEYPSPRPIKKKATGHQIYLSPQKQAIVCQLPSHTITIRVVHMLGRIGFGLNPHPTQPDWGGAAINPAADRETSQIGQIRPSMGGEQVD